MEYEFTSGLHVLIMWKHPQPSQWNSNDYQPYKSLCAQTKSRSFPNQAGTARPNATWKYKHMLRKMVILGERITEGSEDSDDTDTTSIRDIGESSTGILTLMEKLKRRRIENLFIKVTKVME